MRMIKIYCGFAKLDKNAPLDKKVAQKCQFLQFYYI